MKAIQATLPVNLREREYQHFNIENIFNMGFILEKQIVLKILKDSKRGCVSTKESTALKSYSSTY